MCTVSVWGGCAPLETGKFCIKLKQNCGIWWIFLGIKAMKTISQFYRLNQVKLCVLGDLDGGLALMITQAIPLVKQCRDITCIPSTTMIMWFCTSWLQMPSSSESVQAEASISVRLRHRAGPAEGKILKYRCKGDTDLERGGMVCAALKKRPSFHASIVVCKGPISRKRALESVYKIPCKIFF